MAARSWGVGRSLVALVAVAATVAISGCDTTTTAEVTTARVAVGYAFGSLNSATSAGRSPGSALVRGLTQVGFTAVDATGAVVPDTSFGTVEKVSDSPLTVRYRISPDARWSDGVPVTGTDLLLEWAARSGQFDEVVPKLAADGSIADPAALDGAVAFAATSPALVHATATPAFDAHSLTLVYDTPVADWQVALDVNLPAHVIGRLALAAPASGSASPTATAGTPAGRTASATASGSTSPTAGSSATPSTTTPADWAARVAAAIVHPDRAALVAISAAWRTGADAASLAADPSSAVTDGPYRIASITPGHQVVLEPNPGYGGSAKARFTQVEVRSDLDPLAQVNALASNKVDVVAPVDTPDVRKALARVSGATVSEGGDRVLQLQLNERGGGTFDAAAHADTAAPDRAAFLAAIDPAALADAVGAPLSDTVLAQVGAVAQGTGETPAPSRSTGPSSSSRAAATPSGSTSTAATGGPAAGRTVRLLVDTGDPVRAALATKITEEAARAGFTVRTVDAGDLATTLWSKPSAWDAAIVPVAQGELPVAWLVDRWHTGGSTNLTGHSDPGLDKALDALAAQPDPAAVAAGLRKVEDSLVAANVLLPLVRQPVLVATDPAGDSPRIGTITPVTWGAADLSGWWAWALR
jgi:peptide/nickel transport system substrate-binding protein